MTGHSQIKTSSVKNKYGLLEKKQNGVRILRISEKIRTEK